MKKRVLSVILFFAVMLSALSVPAAAADGSLPGFARVNTYRSGLFADVAPSEWYAPYVQACYEYGLLSGRGPGKFEPDFPLTLAEAVKIASCLRSIYSDGAASFPAGTPWYRPYADYALEAGIISSEPADYSLPATRADLAVIFAAALPEEALAQKNRVDDGAIQDVEMSSPYAGAVYRLYRAGVLTGVDQSGRFCPDQPVTRAEVAAIAARMADASFRKDFTLRLQLTAEQIYTKCSPAVFYIAIYDIKGTQVKSGSGFFISADGLAVTNFHVISGAAKAMVTTSDGKEHAVLGVCAYDEEADLAVIKVEGGPFKYLEAADSDEVETGSDAYAIGSPLGYRNTISKGIVSSALRVIDGKRYIQTTAAISSGSSGGALLDSSGKVIGVTTATAVGAQNINIAVPINALGDLKIGPAAPLESLLPETVYYDGHYPVPDFGAYAGAAAYRSESIWESATYYYRTADLQMKLEDAFDGYAKLLEQNTFSFYGYAIEDTRIVSYYMNSAYRLLVTFGEKVVDGVPCVRIQIMGF